MRTEMCLSLLKQQLQLNCGDMLAACKAIGVSLMFVRQWRKDDSAVDAQLAEAEQVGTQGLLSAAIERAVRGVDEDVYYKGEVVGQKKNFSDGLLQTLLKAKLPEFKADGEGGSSVTVNIANIMPRANTYDEWLAMHRATITAPVKALPEPIDAEFSTVDPAFQGIEL